MVGPLQVPLQTNLVLGTLSITARIRFCKVKINRVLLKWIWILTIRIIIIMEESSPDSAKRNQSFSWSFEKCIGSRNRKRPLKVSRVNLGSLSAVNSNQMKTKRTRITMIGPWRGCPKCARKRRTKSTKTWKELVDMRRAKMQASMATRALLARSRKFSIFNLRSMSLLSRLKMSLREGKTREYFSRKIDSFFLKVILVSRLNNQACHFQTNYSLPSWLLKHQTKIDHRWVSLGGFSQLKVPVLYSNQGIKVLHRSIPFHESTTITRMIQKTPLRSAVEVCY